MVNNDKRQRHKAGHRSRVEAARLAEAQRRRRRRLHRRRGRASWRSSACSWPSRSPPATTSETRHRRPTTATHHVRRPAVTAPPPGEAIDGDDAVPAGRRQRERGPPRSTEAPPTCIDDGEDLHRDGRHLRGRHHRRPRRRRTRRSPSTTSSCWPATTTSTALPFHRIVPGFVDQTGSSGVPDIGNGGPGYDLPDEAADARVRGRRRRHGPGRRHRTPAASSSSRSTRRACRAARTRSSAR